jgi:Na+/H+-dicarboxylate symporter
MWPTLVAVFAINALGIPFTPVQYAFLVLLTLAVSVGTVGVPGTATITATALLAALGLPVEVIALVAPISSIVDMGRTATNVLGAAEASVLVAASEGLIDRSIYDSDNSFELMPKRKASAA